MWYYRRTYHVFAKIENMAGPEKNAPVYADEDSTSRDKGTMLINDHEGRVSEDAMVGRTVG